MLCRLQGELNLRMPEVLLKQVDFLCAVVFISSVGPGRVKIRPSRPKKRILRAILRLQLDGIGFGGRTGLLIKGRGGTRSDGSPGTSHLAHQTGQEHRHFACRHSP